MRDNQQHKAWLFDEKIRRSLEAALEAIEDIRRKGFECQSEVNMVGYAIQKLLSAEGRPAPRVLFDEFL